MYVVVRSEPFLSHTGKERISPDKDALLRTGQKGMGAAGDGKVDAGGRWCRVASSQNEQSGDSAGERDGGADAILSFHSLEYNKQAGYVRDREGRRGSVDSRKPLCPFFGWPRNPDQLACSHLTGVWQNSLLASIDRARIGSAQWRWHFVANPRLLDRYRRDKYRSGVSCRKNGLLGGS